MAERELTLKITVGDNEVVKHLRHTDEELEQLKQEAEQAGEAAEEHLDEAAGAADDLGDEADQAADQVESAGQEASGASQNLSSLSDEAYELGDALREGRFDDAASALSRIKSISPGLVATVGGTAAAATATGAAFAYGTSQAISFEEQMLGVKKTTGLTGQDLSALGSDLLDLSGQLGVARGELAAIAETAGQLGIEGRDNITAFTETVAKLSSVSELTADEASRQIAKIANIFDVPIEEANRLGSVLNELSNTTTALSGQIAQGLRRAGAAGEDLGLAVDEVAALQATLVDSGLEAQRAGTSLRNVFTMIRTESDKVADVMDVTSDQLVKMLEEDALGALQKYLTALGDVSEQQRAIEIEETFGKENLQAVQALAAQTDLLSTNLDTANESLEEANSLNKEFEATLGAVSKQWDKLVQNLQAAAIEMSKSVLPAISATLEGLNSLLEDSEATADGVKQVDQAMKELEGAEELADTYDRLSAKSSLTQEESERLESVTETLAKRFPTLVTEYNEAGEAVGIYTDQVREAVDVQQGTLEEQRAQKLQDLGNAYSEAARNVEKFTARQNIFAEDGQTERLEDAKRKAEQARSRVERLAEELTRVYDPSSVSVGQLADDLDVSQKEARSLLTEMQALTEQTEESAEATDENADATEQNTEATEEQKEEMSAAQKVQRGMIESIAEAEQVQKALQKRFKEATTDEARREYQRLIDKVKQMKEEMEAAAQSPPPVPEVPQVEPGHDEAAVIEQNMSFKGDLGAQAQALDALTAAQQRLAGSTVKVDRAISALNTELEKTTDPQKRQAIKSLRAELVKSRAKMQALEAASQAGTQAAIDGFVALGKAIGDSQKTIASFGKTVQGILADLAQTIGKQLIAIGTPMLLTPATAGQGAAYIAAGTALVALGSAIQPSTSGSTSDEGTDQKPRVPRMAEGGRVVGGGMAIVGEEGPEMVNLPGGAEVMPNEDTRTMLNAVRQVPARALAGDDAGVGGGAAGPSNQDVIDELKNTRRAFEEKEFRLRGRDMVTQQERTKRIQRDAGIRDD